MSFELNAMRNLFYSYRSEGYTRATFFVPEKLENKKEVVHLGMLYGIKVKIKRDKKYVGKIYEAKLR